MQPILIVLGLLGIINIVVWQMTKPFGWLSPLKIMKTHRLTNNGGDHIVCRVRFRKGQVRSLGTLENAIKAEGYVFTDMDGMRLLTARQLPDALTIMSETTEGRMAIYCGSAPKHNKLEQIPFLKIDNWTEFAVSPEDIVPAKPVAKEIPESSEVAL